MQKKNPRKYDPFNDRGKKKRRETVTERAETLDSLEKGFQHLKYAQKAKGNH